MFHNLLREMLFPRLILICGVLLLFVSQFFYYLDDPSTGFLSIDGNFNTTGYYTYGVKGTGWALHPHAYVILVVLAFAVLRDDIAGHPLFVRFGYWACLVLIVAGTSPGAYFRASGAGMGGIAILLAFAAAILNQISRKTATSGARTR